MIRTYIFLSIMLFLYSSISTANLYAVKLDSQAIPSPNRAHKILILYPYEHELAKNMLLNELNVYNLRASTKVINLTNHKIDQASASQYQLIISLGLIGLEHALQDTKNTPILAALIQSSVYNELTKKYAVNNPERNIYTVVHEHPLQRHFHLIAAMFNSTSNYKVKLGVILSPNTLTLQPQLKLLAKKHNFELHIMYTKPAELPGKKLSKLLKNCNILLALPDKNIFNPTTAHGLLLAALRSGVPVIGYSKALVNNGGLAGVYTTKVQLLQQTSETALQLLEHIHPPNHLIYPKHYSVAINYHIAHILAKDIGSTQQIVKLMKQNYEYDIMGN